MTTEVNADNNLSDAEYNQIAIDTVRKFKPFMNDKDMILLKRFCNSSIQYIYLHGRVYSLNLIS